MDKPRRGSAPSGQPLVTPPSRGRSASLPGPGALSQPVQGGVSPMSPRSLSPQSRPASPLVSPSPSSPVPRGRSSSGPVPGTLSPMLHAAPRSAPPTGLSPMGQGQASHVDASPPRVRAAWPGGFAPAHAPAQHNLVQPSPGDAVVPFEPSVNRRDSLSRADSPVSPRASHVAINMPAIEDPRARGAPAADAPSRRQQAGRFAPGTDLLAAGASLASTQLTSGSPAAIGVAAASGVLWTGGAALSEAGNTAPRSNLSSFSNAMNGVAGALSTTASLTAGAMQTMTGYASAATWGLSAFASGAQATFDLFSRSAESGSRRLSSGLQLASGVANVAAAGFSAASVRASAENDSANASMYGTISSAAWVAGAGLSMASAHFRPSAAPASPSETTPIRHRSASPSYSAV